MTRKLSSASVIWSRCWLQCQFLRELARGFDSLRDLRLGCSCGGTTTKFLVGAELWRRSSQQDFGSLPRISFSICQRKCNVIFCLMAAGYRQYLLLVSLRMVPHTTRRIVFISLPRAFGSPAICSLFFDVLTSYLSLAFRLCIFRLLTDSVYRSRLVGFSFASGTHHVFLVVSFSFIFFGRLAFQLFALCSLTFCLPVFPRLSVFCIFRLLTDSV